MESAPPGPDAGYAYRGSGDPWTSAYLWPQVLSAIPRDAENLCEVGCGNGAFAVALAGRGLRVVGFDSSESGIAIARERGLRAEFHLRSVEEPVPVEWAGRFDAVVSLEVIEHLYAPRMLAARAFELLKPGGRMILSTPYHGYLKNLVLAVTGKLDAHFTVLWDNGHIKFFSGKTLTGLLESAGFADVRISGCGRMPFLWKSMVATATKRSVA